MKTAHYCLRMALLLCLSGLSPLSIDAADKEHDLFAKKVVPILQARCVTCHNSLDQKGSFSLQTQKEVADSGFVSPGNPNDSHFLKVLLPENGKRPSMPKNGEPLGIGS